MRLSRPSLQMAVFLLCAVLATPAQTMQIGGAAVPGSTKLLRAPGADGVNSFDVRIAQAEAVRALGSSRARQSGHHTEALHSMRVRIRSFMSWTMTTRHHLPTFSRWLHSFAPSTDGKDAGDRNSSRPTSNSSLALARTSRGRAAKHAVLQLHRAATRNISNTAIAAIVLAATMGTRETGVRPQGQVEEGAAGKLKDVRKANKGANLELNCQLKDVRKANKGANLELKSCAGNANVTKASGRKCRMGKTLPTTCSAAEGCEKQVCSHIFVFVYRFICLYLYIYVSRCIFFSLKNASQPACSLV